MNARDLAGIATLVVLVISGLLFAVYFGLYPSLMVFMIFVVVLTINVRNWKRR